MRTERPTLQVQLGERRDECMQIVGELIAYIWHSIMTKLCWFVSAVVTIDRLTDGRSECSEACGRVVVRISLKYVTH